MRIKLRPFPGFFCILSGLDIEMLRVLSGLHHCGLHNILERVKFVNIIKLDAVSQPFDTSFFIQICSPSCVRFPKAY